MNRFFHCCAIISCIALAACGSSDPISENQAAAPIKNETGTEQENSSFDAEDSYREMLLEKANQLARREIARMSAAELLYRNTPAAHRIISADLGANIGVHAKIYRAFNDYTITDIVRSDSFLNPVSYEITYVYDILATEPRPFSMLDSENLARADAQFKVIGRSKMTRRYPADADGEFAGDLPELPPRPDFYKRDAELAEAQPGSGPPSVAPVMGAPPIAPAPAPAGAPPGAMLPPGLQPDFATGDLPGVRMIEPPTGPPPQK